MGKQHDALFAAKLAGSSGGGGGTGDIAGVDMDIDESYVLSAVLKKKDGTNIGEPSSVDLPLEEMIVSGYYDDNTKKVVLNLRNGTVIQFSVADLVSGLQTEITTTNKLSSDLVDDTNKTNLFVTSTEKTTWNGKQNALSFDPTPTDGSTNPVESNGIYDALAGKVDKVQGKGLSTEDYTTTEKTALAGQVTKTAGIDSTANSYIEMGNGLRLYISSTEPTDSDIPEDSVWIGGAVIS